MAEYEKTIAQMIGGCRDRGDQAQLWGAGSREGSGRGDWAARLRASSSKSSCTCDCTLKIPTRIWASCYPVSL